MSSVSLTSLAPVIADNYVRFLMGKSLKETVATLSDGIFPQETNDAFAAHDAAVQDQESDSIQFLRHALTVGYEEALPDQIRERDEYGLKKLPNKTRYIDHFVPSKDILYANSDVISAVGLDLSSLSRVASLVPSYTLFDNGVVVRYLMGDYSLVQDALFADRRFSVLNPNLGYHSYDEIMGPDLVAADRQVLNLPVKIGDKVLTHGGRPYIVSFDDEDALQVSRSAMADPFGDKTTLLAREKNDDRASLVETSSENQRKKLRLLIGKDGNAFFDAFPAKLLRADEDCLVMGGWETFLVRQGGLILCPERRGLRLLQAGTALFSREPWSVELTAQAQHWTYGRPFMAEKDGAFAGIFLGARPEDLRADLPAASRYKLTPVPAPAG